MDNWSRFEETTSPLIDKYSSDVNNSNSSKADYVYSNIVWTIFKIKNLGEYHDLYVQLDTLQLSDVFEDFRKTCLEIYELDPARFISLPSLAWQACLKITNIKLELITDYDMFLMFENGIRGGMCQAITPNIKVYNKYLKNYDKSIPSAFLQYLDTNNLYGWAMIKSLPYAGFCWTNTNTYDEDLIKSYDEYGKYGAILEVDVEYPVDVQIKHKDLAFLPEKRKINNTNKLITTLEDKKNYIVHIKALKQALNHGLKLTKVNRVIEFKQKPWMTKYIDKNTKLRKEAKNEAEKNFFKLMNNAVFGKAMENVRNHRDIKLVNTQEQMIKLVSKPNLHNSSCFSENLMAIEMKKTEVYLNKPIYIGQAILYINKTLIYQF